MKNSLYLIIIRILFLFCAAIIIVNLFKRVLGSGLSLNFDSFLDSLSNVDSMQINFSVDSFIINADWGILNGLKNFINIFAYLFGVIVWLGANLLNLLLFLMQFVRILFV